jgi:small GTP-binding protein
MKTQPRKRRILIVDDDARIVEAIVSGLSGHDALEIHAFTIAGAARDALQHTKFDLVVADWKMPGVDGLTLIGEARKRSRKTVAVLITAFGSSELKSLPEYAYVQHYLEKPFTVDDLISIVASVFPQEFTETERRPSQVFKVILGGDGNVGKTSLIQRYCTGVFDPARVMTIGIDFHVYDIQIEKAPLRLVVWDLGGQERFESTRSAFYRGARAVGLVFDVSDGESFDNLEQWRHETRKYLRDVPVVLLANKTDLPRQVSHKKAAALAKAWDVPLFESSCATGEGVAKFFEALARSAWEHAR